MRERANGHRTFFKEQSYMKSALAFHIWDKRDHFQNKIENFRGGVIKKVLPANLDRAEDYVHVTLILFCLFFGLLSSDLGETWPEWIRAVLGNFFDRSLTSFGGRKVKKQNQKIMKKNIKKQKQI